MERMGPEFLAWRARIDPDDEDDEALADRFLAELPPADAASLGLRRIVAPTLDYASGRSSSPPWPGRRSSSRRATCATPPCCFASWDFDVADVRVPGHALGRRGRREGDGRRALVDRTPFRDRGLRGGARHHPPGHPAHASGRRSSTARNGSRNRDGLTTDGGLADLGRLLERRAQAPAAAPRCGPDPRTSAPTGRRFSRR